MRLPRFRPRVSGASSGAHEGVGRVLDRLPRDVAVPLEVVLLVLLVVALEPHPLRVALGREDVRRDPVEEEAVVAHDDHAARELEQRLARSIAGQGSWLDGPAQALGWGQGGVRASGQGQR